MRAPGKYAFGYHPTTGRYKVVHIPCGRRQVFTLGVDTSWRAVPVDTTPDGGATYNRLCDAISVDGWTYWLDAFSARVMALDLDGESVSWSWGMMRLYQHKVDDLTGGGGGGRRSSAAKGRELLMNEDESNGVLTTFAYVETLEPLPNIQG
nr:unnamed protein product [Digitaria exilis]